VPSSSAEIRFRPLGRGTFVGGFLLTLAVHAALASLIYVAHLSTPPPVETSHEVMITRIVQLGKPRDKLLLPRIVEPPTPKAPEPTLKVTDNPTAAPAKKEPPRQKEADLAKEVKRAMDRARALARNMPEEPPEGSLTGSEHGTSTEASVGDAYLSAVVDAIRKNWSVPAGLSIGDVSSFETDIRVSISDDGTLVNPTMRKSSGNSLYDDSCLAAVQATRRVPPPPASLRARYRRGLVLELGGKDLAR
jgi:TonB family protein